METFDLIINGFEYKNCSIIGANYTNPRNKALKIMHQDGLIAVASVNVDEELEDDCIAIKNWSENIGMDDELKRIGIIEDCILKYIPSGFVKIPVYYLTDKGKRLFKKRG